MKIAITGASGFIGLVLVPQLLAEGHTLQLLTRTARSNTTENVTYIPGDMLQAECLMALVAGADVVIHLAALISIDDRTDDAAYHINTKGTELLLAAAKQAGVRRLIHISSVTAFNQHPCDEPMDEQRGGVIDEGHNYDTSKAVSQGLALAQNTPGFEVIVLAPTAVIGPHDQKPSLLGKAIINIYRGRIPALFPGGVDFVDVRDIVAAIIAALTQGTPGSVYLLSGQWTSLQTLSKETGRAKGKKMALAVVPLWLVFAALPLVKLWARLTGGAPYYTRQSVYTLIYSNKKIDHALATRELHYKPRPFAETLQDTIDWFKQNGLLK
jgi:dihydroflavonol-4-reductase